MSLKLETSSFITSAIQLNSSSTSMAVPSSLTVLLLTVSSISLRRQMAHNSFVTSGTSAQRPANGSTFDYIIVGGGTAGCVLAGRLAAASNTTVLVLEAGGPQSVITDMPGNTLNLVGGEFDWNYRVVRQASAGQAYPEFAIQRGKVFGGSSVVTWDIYNRGNPSDYNNWASQYGLTNFTWPTLLEYFLLFENDTDVSIRSNGLHNNAGPVAVSTETQPDPILLNLQQTMVAAGHPIIDLNGPSQVGTAIAQMFWNNDTALKSSTANAYIEASGNPNRTNLVISTRSTVTGILSSMGGAHASGVQYRVRNGDTMVAFARQEVIICAGAINTPQVLMLSGIGPQDHLNQLGISVVRNLPVGNNLHDMVFVPLYYKITSPQLTDPFPNFDVNNLYRYYVNADGPLAHHPDSVTYHITSNNTNATWPDAMIIGIVEFFNDLNGTVSQYAANTAQWRDYWAPFEQIGYYLAVDPVLARPRSRGTIRLNLSNPSGPPLIDPRYLSEAADFDALLDVTNFTVSMINRYGLPGAVQFPPIPGCPPCLSFCTEYLRCHVRQLSRSYYNFVGSARMGVGASDSGAVVDPTFRVIGFDNLRVVDASVIPEIPNAHTGAIVIALAEKAARLIMRGE